MGNTKPKHNSRKYDQNKLIKYPEVRLNTNLMIPILLYLNDEEILMDAMILNKKINERLRSRIMKEKKNFMCNKYLPGRSNMNEVYCEFDMKDYYMKNYLPNITVSVETKDQGWASVNCSSSWVELRFKNKTTQKITSYDIGRNFKEKDFKQLRLMFDHQSTDRNLEIYNHLNDENNIVQIVARSAFPGWVCHIRRAEFDFRYFYINRQN